VQFGSAPRGVFLSICQGDIFAAAEERVRLCESCEFGAQRESLLQCADDFSITGARCEKLFCGNDPTGRGVAGDLTFDNRKLHAADPGGLACAVDTGLRGLLKLAHFDAAIHHPASQRAGQLKIWNEMKSASQEIALDFADTMVIGDLHRLQALLSNCGDRPSTREVGGASRAKSKLRCFH
jgi:hypothetical protein